MPKNLRQGGDWSFDHKKLVKPDLAKSDFLLFPHTKRGIKVHCFDKIEEFRNKKSEEMSVISKNDYKHVANSGITGGTPVGV